MMALLLVIFALVLIAYGTNVIHDAAMIFQQIAGLCVFVCAATLLAGAFIVNAIDVMRRQHGRLLKQIHAAVVMQGAPAADRRVLKNAEDPERVQ
jgi:hypothetical protein